MAKRTTQRSSAGKKLLAVRDAAGQFKDIQTYERAHAQDLLWASADEVAKIKKAVRRRKKAARKTIRKAVRKVARRRKAVRRATRKVARRRVVRKRVRRATRKTTRK